MTVKSVSIIDLI